MIEALVSDIRRDAQYRREFDDLVLDRMDQSLTRAGSAEDPGPGPIERLVQSAGILSLSGDPVARREAFTIASATYELYGEELGGLGDALALVMSRLGNFPTIDFLSDLRDRPSGLPTPALLETTGRRIANTVTTRAGEITLTDYQRSVWQDVSERRSVIASAPTSAGKSFLFQRHIADGFHAGTLRNAAIIVPTRALIAQVSAALAPMIKDAGTPPPRLVTVPVARPDDGAPTVYVMTQERLQVLLADPAFTLEVAMIDEAHLVGDGPRGIVLQSVIDELVQRDPKLQLLFTLPRVRNADDLASMFDVADARVRRTDDSPVGQNIILLDVQQAAPDLVNARRWSGTAHPRHVSHQLPVALVAPDQKLVYLSWFYGRGSQSIVYGDTPARCEKLALLLCDVVDEQEQPEEDLRFEARRDLAKFVADHVHQDYVLAQAVMKGVGFHYGNMPALVRQAIEQAFDERLLDFIVCTSTLLQGVNLPARNIFMRRPEKGEDQPLGAVDFWNLAGRAGRLGKEFEGNVFLVDYDEWDAKPLEERQDGDIRSSMKDQIVGGTADLLAYIADPTRPTDGNSTLENSFARLFRDFRQGRLERTLDKLDVPAGHREDIRTAIEKAAATVKVNDETLAANPYLSPHRQQRLYDKLRRDVPKKGVDYYMPPHPAGEWEPTRQRLIDVYKRLQVELDGVKGRGFVWWATLSLLWMRGEGLPDLIEYQINRDGERVIAERAAGGRPRGRASATIIRTMLQNIESGVRYKFVRQMACYNSVLRQVLIELGETHAATHIPAIPLFLEVGASSGTMLTFIDLGLSRISARLLQSKATNYDMNPEQALDWLRRQDLSAGSLPPVVLRELDVLLP
ncbi:DEAD/DEAH box helicase [Roseomonas aeriglobus]|nr:DEAD/DEAH box helicase [Roseomonas aeriglobus]